MTALAKKARSVVRDLDPHNDLTFFRVRGKNKQEILVAPDKHLFLIVIQKTEFDEQWFAKIVILSNEIGLQISGNAVKVGLAIC